MTTPQELLEQAREAAKAINLLAQALECPESSPARSTLEGVGAVLKLYGPPPFAGVPVPVEPEDEDESYPGVTAAYKALQASREASPLHPEPLAGEREAFEKWCEADWSFENFERCSAGSPREREYHDSQLEDLWSAWQARASLPQPARAVPLTDGQIDALDTFALYVMAPRQRASVRMFARAIEAAHGIAAPPHQGEKKE